VIANPLCSSSAPSVTRRPSSAAPSASSAPLARGTPRSTTRSSRSSSSTTTTTSSARRSPPSGAPRLARSTPTSPPPRRSARPPSPSSPGWPRLPRRRSLTTSKGLFFSREELPRCFRFCNNSRRALLVVASNSPLRLYQVFSLPGMPSTGKTSGVQGFK
jgi:hypothetical protein